MAGALEDRIEAAAGIRPTRIAPLSGGRVSQVYKVEFKGSQPLVAKYGPAGGGLAIEGAMLRYLAANTGLPMPVVISADDGLLLIEYIDAPGPLTAAAEAHAAELLAEMHAAPVDGFGFATDTLIGGIHQPNPAGDDWIAFFRDQRLLYMAGEALRWGNLPAALMARIEVLAGRLADWIPRTSRPALIHGDMWGGNILCRDGRVAAFIDPAIYHAEPEIELAFATLFATFGTPFFGRYRDIRPIAPGFFEERRALYNLYPLLVHVRLFGGHYVASVEATLSQLGC
jgi:fructosamine-3-kinase